MFFSVGDNSSSESGGIASSKKVIRAVENLCQKTTATGLWNIRNIGEQFKQGTSFNEGLHSRFSALKPATTARQTHETCQLVIDAMVLIHNRQIGLIHIFSLCICKKCLTIPSPVPIHPYLRQLCQFSQIFLEFSETGIPVQIKNKYA